MTNNELIFMGSLIGGFVLLATILLIGCFIAGHYKERKKEEDMRAYNRYMNEKFERRKKMTNEEKVKEIDAIIHQLGQGVARCTDMIEIKRQHAKIEALNDTKKILLEGKSEIKFTSSDGSSIPVKGSKSKRRPGFGSAPLSF